ncbi:MAG TPA: FAD-dependent oxidoreductase, partial [Burkholderiaceae bacterium]
MNKRKILLAALVAAAIAAFFALGLQRYLGLEAFRSERAALADMQAAHPFAFAALYFAAYVAVAALSLPGAAVMTLVGGALFGLAAGTLLVSFASSIGAACAFAVSRFVLREAVRARFGEALRRIDAGIRKEGPFYLFALRLVPLFPFFAINLALGLTDIGAWTFYWVSQLGMLPGTLVYVYAGAQLGRFEISGGLVAALAALGLFPLAARRVLDALEARKVYARWKRPPSYDYNLVVIGAGSAGLVASYIAAATRARVALVEKHRMGGDCLNTGCVPSKALIRAARLLSQLARSRELGIARASAEFDFGEVMERVALVVRAVEPHDSAERYRALGVECLRGSARLTSPWTVEVDGPDGSRRLTTRSVVIAAGARPFVPPIPGLNEIGYLTSDTVWDLRRQPRRLLVLGGGPIGAELAQAFARLGSEVTVVEMLPRILVREDLEVSRLVTARFEREGMRVLAGHRAARFAIE